MTKSRNLVYAVITAMLTVAGLSAAFSRTESPTLEQPRSVDLPGSETAVRYAGFGKGGGLYLA